MPKSKEYLSSSESDSDGADEPKPKKKKTEEAKPEAKASKSPEKAGKKSGPTKGSGGEFMFQLSRMRFATVGEFRGKVMIGIREYYEKDDELRPGKKGISLTPEQWQALKDNIEEIDKCVEQL